MATVVTFSPDVRVTELPNPLTADLDVAPSDAAVVRLFGASDAAMFSGFGGLPHLSSPECVAALSALVDALAVALYQPHGRVVFAGCGTSGRLSHFLARGLNAWAAAQLGHTQPRFHYLLAGGDAALLLPQEAVEDQPTAGVDDFERWEAAAGASPLHPVVIVGISCGLSATYVGSMLAAAITRPGYTAVCVGFNPIEGASTLRRRGAASTWTRLTRAAAHRARRHSRTRRVCPTRLPPLPCSRALRARRRLGLLIFRGVAGAGAPCVCSGRDARGRAGRDPVSEGRVVSVEACAAR